jgi:hypothetical protein
MHLTGPLIQVARACTGSKKTRVDTCYCKEYNTYDKECRHWRLRPVCVLRGDQCPLTVVVLH